MIIVDDFNRTEIQRNYIDYLLGKMDFMEVKRELWNYINRDKNRYSNYSLELEISRDAPQILGDLVTDSLHLKKSEPLNPPKKSGKKLPLTVGGGI